MRAFLVLSNFLIPRLYGLVHFIAECASATNVSMSTGVKYDSVRF